MPNIMRVIKWRRMRWVEHVACMQMMQNAYKILVGKPERYHSEDLGTDGRIILQWISE
jgi:uncharacterized membrane protein